jgi:hypothetical protein
MSSSKNGSIVGQVLKGIFTVAIAIFTAKQGHSKWKEKSSKKS